VHINVKDAPAPRPQPSKTREYFNLSSLMSYSSCDKAETIPMVAPIEFEDGIEGYDDLIKDTLINLLLQENASHFLYRRSTGICQELKPLFDAAVDQSDVAQACMLLAVDADAFLDRRSTILAGDGEQITAKAVQLLNAWGRKIRRIVDGGRLISYKRVLKRFGGTIKVGASCELSVGNTTFVFESLGLASAMTEFVDDVVYLSVNTGQMCRMVAPVKSVVLAQLELELATPSAMLDDEFVSKHMLLNKHE